MLREESGNKTTVDQDLISVLRMYVCGCLFVLKKQIQVNLNLSKYDIKLKMQQNNYSMGGARTSKA